MELLDLMPGKLFYFLVSRSRYCERILCFIMTFLYYMRILFLSTNIYMQEKYEKATASLAQMEERVVMAETMLEATLQYQSGQVKALSSPRYVSNSSDRKYLFS